MSNVSAAMIFKSIKWRLQIWYGLILVLVLVGFGATAYQLEWGRQMRRIDEELQRRVGMVADALRPPPPGPGMAGGPPASPPPDRFPGDRAGQSSADAPAEFHLPPRAAGLFGPSNPNNFYYLIFHDGKEIASGNRPDMAVIEGVGLMSVFTLSHFSENVAKPPPPITVGGFRNMCRPLPSGDVVWVGCSIAPELKELNHTALKLGGAGGIILLLGLAGGWWLVGRAIRPINDISAAAMKISTGDLSQRINSAETESELGKLASVLNSTFARLETAFDQQRQFAADAAHELRTPVSVMLTQTQTALQRERSAAEYRETIEACQRASQRMRQLIESLLQLARLDAGQETLKRMKFDLSQTIRDCAELVHPLAAARGIKIHREIQPVEAYGDAERLAQVVTNLLANAIQYNKDSGEVRISLKGQGAMILLVVSDTGPGISETDLPHVFERFYRADASRSSGQTGLGLAICKAIVEAHGGTIEVASRIGDGTTFTVRLPMI